MLRLGVHRVHPVQAVGEQGAFLAADAAPDLHDDALVVVRVAREKENFQFLLQRLQLFLVLGKFLLAERLHLRLQPLGEHGAQILLLRLRAPVAAVGRDDGLELPLLLQQLRGRLRVVIKIRLRGPLGHFEIPRLDQLQFLQHVLPHKTRISEISYSILSATSNIRAHFVHTKSVWKEDAHEKTFLSAIRAGAAAAGARRAAAAAVPGADV